MEFKGQIERGQENIHFHDFSCIRCNQISFLSHIRLNLNILFQEIFLLKTSGYYSFVTGNSKRTARSNRFCWAKRPRSRYTFSQLNSGYFSPSNSANLMRPTFTGNPTSLNSVRVIEYQSSGWWENVKSDREREKVRQEKNLG